jgi:hypothetical protein
MQNLTREQWDERVWRGRWSNRHVPTELRPARVELQLNLDRWREHVSDRERGWRERCDRRSSEHVSFRVEWDHRWDDELYPFRTAGL